jgi:hypothetical protein
MLQLSSENEGMSVIYSESGEYLFPEGIDIYYYGSPADSPDFYVQGYSGSISFDPETRVYTHNFRKPNRPDFDVRKITIHGLPAFTSQGEQVAYSIQYRETFKELPESAPNGFTKFFTESGVYEFPDGIDVFLCGINVDTDEFITETPFDDECFTVYIERKTMQ